MAERSILAYFNSPDQAEQALSQLKQLKLVDSRIDRFDGMPGDGTERVTNPATAEFRRLGNLTLNGDFLDRDTSVLAAASVSAYSMSAGSPENQVTGRDILLTAIVDEQDYDKAMEICANSGAL